MEPTRELGDALYREHVLRARATPPEQKLIEGFRLFEYECQVEMDGIRDQNPGLSDAEILAILKERLALRRQLEVTRWI